MKQPKISSVALTALLMLTTTLVNASQRSISLDSNGYYSGIVIKFSDDFRADGTPSPKDVQAKIVESIMNQVQNASDVLYELIGVQFGDVTIVIPDHWQINADSFNEPNVKAAQSQPLESGDIIYTEPSETDKWQVLTLQYGQCGESGLPINYPKTILSDPASQPGRLLAHQWLLYRYGVFNEFGYTSDIAYPVFYSTPDGGARDNTTIYITGCGVSPNGPWQKGCHDPLSTNSYTGKPIDAKCDITPTGSGSSPEQPFSFMYAPIANVNTKLCEAKTHDRRAPNKQNILCDYQSPYDVILKHTDFDYYKPKSGAPKMIKNLNFHIWQNQKDYQRAFVMYAVPNHKNVFLKDLLNTVERLSIRHPTLTHHIAQIATYDDTKVKFLEWYKSSQLTSSFEKDPIIKNPIRMNHTLLSIRDNFSRNTKGGVCLFFLHGDTKVAVDQANDNRLADELNKANVVVKFIIFDTVPSKATLAYIHSLSSKLRQSSVDYAFAESNQASQTNQVLRNQIFSTMNTIVLDTLTEVCGENHMLIKRETVRDSTPIHIDFSLKNIHDGQQHMLIIELYTSGDSGKLSNNNKLQSSHGVLNGWEKQENQVVSIYFENIDNDRYAYSINTPGDGYVTVSIRLVSTVGKHNSYKVASVAGKCWLAMSDAHSSAHYPMRGYVQLSQGLDGPANNADVMFFVRRYDSQQSEMSIVVKDNGNGSPDITANDGIFSAYMGSVFNDFGAVDTMFTVSARIKTESLYVKQGGFGNTAMITNKQRCCGNSINTGNDHAIGSYEQVINCGSFFRRAEDISTFEYKGYAINNLNIHSVDAENRTVSIEWDSPFMATASTQPTVVVKAFHSKQEVSDLPAQIKNNFDHMIEAEIKVIEEEDPSKRPAFMNTFDVAPYEIDNNPAMSNNNNINNNNNNNNLPIEHSPEEPQTAGKSPITFAENHRKAKIQILSPEEGFYLVVVKERDDVRETKPSNIVTFYTKSNVPIANTTALAFDDSNSQDGPFREPNKGPLTLGAIIIIVFGSILVLFILVLVLLVFVIRRRRKLSGKDDQHSEYRDFKEPIGGSNSPKKSDADQTDAKQSGGYYIAQDAASLRSHSVQDRSSNVPHSNQSQNTSCSSVNTVDQTGLGPANGGGAAMYLPYHDRMSSLSSHNANRHRGSIDHQQQQVVPQELTIGNMLPNSWDAKELLNHWERVQESKHQQQQHPGLRFQSSHSPSVPSYGESANDYSQHQQQQQQQQQAQAQALASGGYYAQPSLVHAANPHAANEIEVVGEMLGAVGEYHGHHQPTHSMYSPYSNASSIWQHHHQQQQQQPHYVPGPYHMASPAFTTNTGNGYDDNGLPEYSVVRKVHHPNISQV